MSVRAGLLVALLCTGCMDELLAPRARADLGCDDVQVTATWAGEYAAPFQGTPVGECVAGKFRRATVPTFTRGPRVTKKSFDVPTPPEAAPAPST